MATIRIRRATAATAASNNPVLASGEPGFETDTGVFKIGDGTTAWNDLPELGGGQSLFLGLYTSLSALETAHDTAESGQYAIVDPGPGTDAVKYIWDEDEGWVEGGSTSGVITDGQGTTANGTSVDLGGSVTQNTSINLAAAKYFQISAPSAALVVDEVSTVVGTQENQLTLSTTNAELSITNSLIVSGSDLRYQTPPSSPDNNTLVHKGYVDTKSPKVVHVAASDESTPLTTGTSKITFRMPYAMTLTEVRASLGTAQESGSILTIDINESGATILSTKLTIDNNEKTSTTAATPAVISDATLVDDAEITVDIDQVGDGTAAGLKITLIGV
jgi:hypothetical protein